MSPAEIKFEVEDRNGIRVVHVFGSLDAMTYDSFKAYMEPLIGASRTRLVLDCENLTFVNSRGVTLLMQLQRKATQGFSFFGLAAVRRHTLKNIELLGLGKLLARYPTIEEAVQMAVAM